GRRRDRVRQHDAAHVCRDAAPAVGCDLRRRSRAMNAGRRASIATLRRAALVLATGAGAVTFAAHAGTVLVSLPLEAGDGGNDHVLPTPSLSADGRYVAFTSYASNLTDDTPNPNDDDPDVYVRDLLLGTTVRVSDPADGGDYANARSVAPS